VIFCVDCRPRIRQDNVKDFYKLGRTLGQGGFAAVKEATHKVTGEKFACKIMNLPKEGQVVSPDEFTRCVGCVA
jgi:calcium/calmodulin-dependent protein kinase I